MTIEFIEIYESMMTYLSIKNTPVRVGLLTGAAMIVAKILSLLMAYDLFHFDTYLALVAVSFLTVGHLLTDVRDRSYNMVKFETSDIDSLTSILKCLSSRELSVLKMISTGHTNKEIAFRLGIELSTVKTHVNNTYLKIRCKNRKEAREKWNEWAKQNLIS